MGVLKKQCGVDTSVCVCQSFFIARACLYSQFSRYCDHMLCLFVLLQTCCVFVSEGLKKVVPFPFAKMVGPISFADVASPKYARETGIDYTLIINRSIVSDHPKKSINASG